MTVLSNSCEGGVNNVDVTIANSGGASGNAFNGVFRGGSSIVKYDNTQAAHGLISIRCTGSGSTCGPQWTGITTSLVAARFYIRFSVLPTANCILISFPTASMGFSSTGKFNMWNASTIVSTFTGAVSTGVWYRLEMEAQNGTTTANGYLSGRYFLGDAATPVETQYSSNVQNTGTGSSLTNVVFGFSNNTSAIAWIDDLNVNNATTTPIGPVAPAVAAFEGWGIPL